MTARLFFRLIVVFTAMLAYETAAVPKFSVYKDFLESLTGGHCPLPKMTPVVISDECAETYVPNSDNTTEMAVLCSEIYEVLHNITSFCKIKGDFMENPQPTLEVQLATDVCGNFKKLEPVMPTNKRYLGRALADEPMICKMLCNKERKLMCQFLLWSYLVQENLQEKTKNYNTSHHDFVSDASSHSGTLSGNKETVDQSLKNNLTATKDKTTKSMQQPKTNSISTLGISHPLGKSLTTVFNNSVSVSDATYVTKGESSKNTAISDSTILVHSTTNSNIIPTQNDANKNSSAIYMKKNKADQQIENKNTISRKDPIQKEYIDTPVTGATITLKPDEKALHASERIPNDVEHGSTHKYDKDNTQKTEETSFSTSGKTLENNVQNEIVSILPKTVNAASSTVSQRLPVDGQTIRATSYVNEIENELPSTNLTADIATASSLNGIEATAKSDFLPPIENMSTLDALLEEMENSNNELSSNDEELPGYDSTFDEPDKSGQSEGKLPSSDINKLDNISTNDKDEIINTPVVSKPIDKLPDRTFSDREIVNQLPGMISEQEDNNFFFYFLTIVLISLGGYLLYTNKQKIIALIVEGRHERRRRPHGVNYKKLETN